MALAYMTMTNLTLNSRGTRLCEQLIDRQSELRVQWLDNGIDPPVVDCGIQVAGSLEAGTRLSEICMAGLGTVTLSSSSRWFPFAQAQRYKRTTPCEPV